MKLTGTAGRVLLARLNAVRLQGKDRAASNDNRPVKEARVSGGEKAPALASEKER